jgi:hypothetical protein
MKMVNRFNGTRKMALNRRLIASEHSDQEWHNQPQQSLHEKKEKAEKTKAPNPSRSLHIC